MQQNVDIGSTEPITITTDNIMIKSVDTLVTTKMFPMTCNSWALYRD